MLCCTHGQTVELFVLYHTHVLTLFLYHTRPHLYGQTDELFNYYAVLHTVHGQAVKLFVLYHSHVLTFTIRLCTTHIIVKQVNCLIALLFCIHVHVCIHVLTWLSG